LKLQLKIILDYLQRQKIMRVKLKTEPTIEPVTVNEMKTHLHMDSDVTAEDTYLSSLIIAARTQVEQHTRRALITQTWYQYLDSFPSDNYIKLPFGELSSVTSVKYKTSAGVETALTVTTQYLVDSDAEPGRIVLPYSVSWPSFTAYSVNPIIIEFICGYGVHSNVPESLKAAIKLIVGDLYEGNFEVNEAAQNLMRSYKLWDNFK
jgi:uncharacterized phiE125 gp8 family phage protein